MPNLLFNSVIESAAEINSQFKREITMNHKSIWSKGMLKLAGFFCGGERSIEPHSYILYAHP